MSKLQISARAKRTPPSPIRKLAHLAQQAKAAGTHVYHLNIGQPDIKTPGEFFEGVALYGEEVLAYEQSQGNPALAHAWSQYMNRTLYLHTAPEHFLITTGASEALIFVFMLCCDPADEVLVLDPTYANYIGFSAVAGVTLVPVATRLEDGFRLPPPDELRRHVSARTRAVLLCSPNNPTGTVYSREELQGVLDLCEEQDLFLVVDETYREFVYDNQTPLSILHLAPNLARVIVIDSLSKRFSLCGARLGAFITTNEELLAAGLALAQARLAAPTIEQFAAAHMLRTIADDFILKVRGEYELRRTALLDALAQIPSLHAHKPTGAFYTVVRLPVYDADEFARFLLRDFSLNKATTFVAPAAGFYMQAGEGRNEIRIAYVLARERISEAVSILGEGVEAYKRTQGGR